MLFHGIEFLLSYLYYTNKAASELRKQAGDMFRCKKVKGERPSPLLFFTEAGQNLKGCYKMQFLPRLVFIRAIFLQYLRQ